MKIFISGINTQLGYHLVQSLRQDHVKLEGYSVISGSLCDVKRQFLLHDSIHKTFNFQTHRDLTVKNAVQSDVLIFDIRNNPAPEVQFILKVLKNYNIKKPLRVVGISNFMTWSNCKTSQFSALPFDKQTLLEYTLNKQHWKRTQLDTESYKTRVAHPMFVYNYLLEEQIMNLECHNKFINANVICTGVLYGNSGFDLRDIIESGVSCQESQIAALISMSRLNQQSVLPFSHIDQVLSAVEDIVYGSQNDKQSTETKVYTKYQIVCEDQCRSMVEIIEKINKTCGYNSKDNVKTQINQPSLTLNNDLLIPQPQLLCLKPQKQLFGPSSKFISRSSAQLLPSFASLPSGTSPFIAELQCRGKKELFSLLMNMKMTKSSDKSSKCKKKMMNNDSRVNQANLLDQSCNQDDDMLKKNTQQDRIKEKQAQFSSWIQNIVEEFLQYRQVQFEHILFPQELYLNSQSRQKLQNLSKYYVLDRQQLNRIMLLLLQKGQISNQRTLTPQEQKKKPPKKPESRESVKRQQYELFFPEIMKHFFASRKNSHFVICIKQQLIQRLLSFMDLQPEFSQFNQWKFINVIEKTGKQQNVHRIKLLASERISRTVQIDSEQFDRLVWRQSQPLSSALSGQSSRCLNIDRDKQSQKVCQKKNRQAHQINLNDSQAQEQIKINLISQYLLDNLIVYAAQAKQQLKLKDKNAYNNCQNGQKIEGKQQIRQFIEELKKIRARELAQVRQYEDEIQC